MIIRSGVFRDFVKNMGLSSHVLRHALDVLIRTGDNHHDVSEGEYDHYISYVYEMIDLTEQYNLSPSNLYLLMEDIQRDREPTETPELQFGIIEKGLFLYEYSHDEFVTIADALMSVIDANENNIFYIRDSTQASQQAIKDAEFNPRVMSTAYGTMASRKLKDGHSIKKKPLVDFMVGDAVTAIADLSSGVNNKEG